MFNAQKSGAKQFKSRNQNGLRLKIKMPSFEEILTEAISSLPELTTIALFDTAVHEIASRRFFPAEELKYKVMDHIMNNLDKFELLNLETGTIKIHR